MAKNTNKTPTTARQPRTSILLGLSFLAVSLFSISFFTSPSNDTVKSVDDHKVLGASITTAGYTIEIERYDYASFSATTNQLTFSVKISNTSQDTLQISPGLQMNVIDHNGTAYPATAKFLDVNKSIGGPINPGGNSVLNIDFELPVSERARLFTFQKDASSPVLTAEL